MGQEFIDENKFQTFSSLVKVSMVLKFIMVGDLILEFVMYLFEIYKLNQLAQSSVDIVVRFSEKRRRRIFARKYMIRTLIWLLLIVIGLGITTLVVKEQKCESE